MVLRMGDVPSSSKCGWTTLGNNYCGKSNLRPQSVAKNL